MKKKRKRKMKRVGLAAVPKTRHRLDVNLFAEYILDGQISKYDHPPMCLEQPSPKAELLADSDIQYEDLEFCDDQDKPKDGKSGSSLGSIKITSYTELYSLDAGLNDKRKSGSPIDLAITKQRESGSYGTVSPIRDCVMTTSDSPSFVHDELENIILLSPTDSGDCYVYDYDKSVGSSFDPVPQNWSAKLF